MTFQLAEGFVNALEAYLSANMTAKLAALDTEYTDAIVLEAPVAGPAGRFAYVGVKSLTQIANYPALYIVSPEQEVEPWNAYDDGSTIKSKPQVYVGMLAIDMDQENLQLRLYRYARAIVELAMEGMGAQGLDGWDIVGNFVVDSATGGPLDTPEDGDNTPFIGEVSVGMRGQKTETK